MKQLIGGVSFYCEQNRTRFDVVDDVLTCSYARNFLQLPCFFFL